MKSISRCKTGVIDVAVSELNEPDIVQVRRTQQGVGLSAGGRSFFFVLEPILMSKRHLRLATRRTSRRPSWRRRTGNRAVWLGRLEGRRPPPVGCLCESRLRGRGDGCSRSLMSGRPSRGTPRGRILLLALRTRPRFSRWQRKRERHSGAVCHGVCVAPPFWT